MESEPPTHGPPAHHIHVIWLAACAEDAQEYYDELDADRWSIRCVRVYREGRSEAFSHASPNWRDVMPEAPVDTPDMINRDTQFRARAISAAEFEAAWLAALPENPLDFNVVDDAGQFLCPCCGFSGQFDRAPYRSTGGVIGTGICGGCFWEPGFDDDPMASEDAKPTIKASLLTYRAAWIAADYPWRASTPPPAGWDGHARCEALLHRHPHLSEI